MIKQKVWAEDRKDKQGNVLGYIVFTDLDNMASRPLDDDRLCYLISATDYEKDMKELESLRFRMEGLEK